VKSVDSDPAERHHLGVEAPDRLRFVAGRLGLDPGGARLLDSYSNVAWQIGKVVVRICWLGDRSHLHREALVLKTNTLAGSFLRALGLQGTKRKR
jgi:hypothetical protein